MRAAAHERAAAGRGDRIYRFAAGHRTARLPDEVVLKTKIHIIDSLAAIVSGSALEAGIAGRRYAEALGGRGVATILGTATKVPMIEAALANGMSAHADESDDSHETSQSHPGCGILPAALAVAEARGATGADLLHAVWMAYELTIRFGEAMAPAMTFARSSRSCHAYSATFGAGFAAGALMAFSADQFRILVNYLAQEASGLTTWRLDRAHTLKSYVFAGMPASNGVKAAALVASGFTGSGDVLDPADRNLLDAISPECDRAPLDGPLDGAFRILETDIKKYSVGFPIAAPVAALEEILARHRPAPEAVRAIRVRYAEDWYAVIGDANRMPDLNLRHCLAITMLDGRLTFAASHDEARMAAPEVVAMGRRIAFLPPREGQDRFEAEVEVETAEARHVARQGLAVRGRKDNPMTVAEVHDKATELLTMVISPDAARALIEAVHRIEDARDIAGIVALCAAAPSMARAARS